MERDITLLTVLSLSLHYTMAPKADAVPDVVDDDAPGPPISVPDSGDTGEGGKLKMIIQLVKKCLGVKDIASMYVVISGRLSAR